MVPQENASKNLFFVQSGLSPYVLFLRTQAIDVWMGVCTAFVFAALVEFTFVNYLWRQTAEVGAGVRFDAAAAMAAASSAGGASAEAGGGGSTGGINNSANEKLPDGDGEGKEAKVEIEMGLVRLGKLRI